METSAPRAGSQVVATTARHSAAYRADPLRVSSRDKLTEMAASSQGNFEGNFESLDLAEFAKKQPWWRKCSGRNLDLQQKSIAWQPSCSLEVSLDGAQVSYSRRLESWLQQLWEVDFFSFSLQTILGTSKLTGNEWRRT
nr:DC44 [Homo sapiens]